MNDWAYISANKKLKKAEAIIQKLYSGEELIEEEETYCQELFK